MDSVIKNLHLLENIIPKESLEALNEGAKLHKRYSRIYFEVLNVSKEGKKVDVFAWQTRTDQADRVADAIFLRDCVDNSFKRFLKDWEVTTYVDVSLG